MELWGANHGSRRSLARATRSVVTVWRARGGGAGASTAVHDGGVPPSAETLADLPEDGFDKLDADGCETLERSKVVEAMVGAGYAEERAVAFFEELDADDDGKVTKQEWRDSLAHAKHRRALERYTQPESIWTALLTGHVKLVKMSWLIAHADAGGILPHRQALL